MRQRGPGGRGHCCPALFDRYRPHQKSAMPKDTRLAGTRRRMTLLCSVVLLLVGATAKADIVVDRVAPFAGQQASTGWAMHAGELTRSHVTMIGAISRTTSAAQGNGPLVVKARDRDEVDRPLTGLAHREIHHVGVDGKFVR